MRSRLVAFFVANPTKRKESMQDSSIKLTQTMNLPSGKNAKIKAHVTIADTLEFDMALIGDHEIGVDTKLSYRDLYRLHRAWLEKLLLEYDGQTDSPVEHLVKNGNKQDYDFIITELDKIISQTDSEQAKKSKAGASNTNEPSE